MSDFFKVVDVAAHVAGARLSGDITEDQTRAEIALISAKAGLSAESAGNVGYLVKSFLALERVMN